MDSAAVVTRAVNSAVSALLKYKTKQQSATDKLQLLPQDDYIYLNLTLKKIPNSSRTNPFRIPLPHPILDATSELCLIIDDRANTPTPPSDQIKKLIKSMGIPISKVIRLSKLKANYKSFESRRKLCDSYDMFLVDKRIVHLLPKLIGKEFFKKKKLPLGVDLGKKNLKGQVERALGSALLYIRTGTCCVMKVGKVDMEEGEIVENVIEAIKGAMENVPRKWDGIRSLHLKFSDSVALPVYQTMPDVTSSVEGKSDGVVAKASDSEGEAKVGKSGKGKGKKGRIHEVRYMDVGDDAGNEVDEVVAKVEEIDDDLGVDGSVGKKRKGNKDKKKVKGEESVAKKAKKTGEKKAKNDKVDELKAEEEEKKGKKKKNVVENEVDEKSGKEKKSKKTSKVEKEVKELESGEEKKNQVEQEGKELQSEKKAKKNKGQVEQEATELKSGEDKKANKKNKKKSEVEEVNELKSGEEKKSKKKKRELGEEISELKSLEKKAKKKSKEIDEPVPEVKAAKQKRRTK